MTREQIARLDAVADGLGDLYQRFGRFTDRLKTSDPEVAQIFDDILCLIEDVEIASARNERLHGAERRPS